MFWPLVWNKNPLTSAQFYYQTHIDRKYHHRAPLKAHEKVVSTFNIFSDIGPMGVKSF